MGNQFQSLESIQKAKEVSEANKAMTNAQIMKAVELKVPSSGIKFIDRAMDSMPKASRMRYAKCMSGKISLRSAIKMKCNECVGHQRPEVTQCSSYGCPLWPYRPYQDK